MHSEIMSVKYTCTCTIRQKYTTFNSNKNGLSIQITQFVSTHSTSIYISIYIYAWKGFYYGFEIPFMYIHARNPHILAVREIFPM